MPDSFDTQVLVLPSGQAVGTGLKLAAGDFSLPPDYGLIQWIRTSDGAAVAVMGGYLAVDTTFFTLTNQRPAPQTSFSQLLLEAADDGVDPVFTRVTAKAHASLGSSDKLITDGTGNSDFVKMGRPATPQSMSLSYDSQVVATPAAPVGTIFGVNVVIPNAAKPNGVAQKAVVGTSNNSGAVGLNVPIEATIINNGNNDTVRFIFRNNTGGALAISSVGVSYIVVF